MILQSQRGEKKERGRALDKISVEAQQNRPLKSTGLECEQAVNRDAISRAAACDHDRQKQRLFS